VRIEGYAAKYGVETTIGGLFVERIEKGAFAAAAARDDARALYNHDPNVVLGRKSAGTLRMRDDAVGLYYSVDINLDDPAAKAVAARVSRRDVTGSSFWFEVDGEDGEEWRPAPDRKGLPLRILRKLKLVDVSPVTFPAYPQATASAVRTVGSVAIRDRVRSRIQIAKAQASSQR
jgi:HK97 family phage prohead protease